ncbi:hypothetical protein JCM10908_002620 [Rhodotorula pacifica]|uniref:uncharacterized protein n=1 Tax=Rhodotorula pacifica TaxID=1495444 RepID=UPI003173F6DB
MAQLMTPVESPRSPIGSDKQDLTPIALTLSSPTTAHTTPYTTPHNHNSGYDTKLRSPRADYFGFKNVKSTASPGAKQSEYIKQTAPALIEPEPVRPEIRFLLTMGTGHKNKSSQVSDYDLAWRRPSVHESNSRNSRRTVAVIDDSVWNTASLVDSLSDTTSEGGLSSGSSFGCCTSKAIERLDVAHKSIAGEQPPHFKSILQKRMSI